MSRIALWAKSWGWVLTVSMAGDWPFPHLRAFQLLVEQRRSGTQIYRRHGIEEVVRHSVDDNDPSRSSQYSRQANQVLVYLSCYLPPISNWLYGFMMARTRLDEMAILAKPGNGFIFKEYCPRVYESLQSISIPDADCKYRTHLNKQNFCHQAHCQLQVIQKKHRKLCPRTSTPLKTKCCQTSC